MEVYQVPQDTVLSLERKSPSEAPQVDLFELGGIEHCQLSCSNWRMNLASKSRYKDRKAMKKKSPPNDSSTFNLQQIKSSATLGCMSCALFGQLLQKILTSRGHVNMGSVVFKFSSNFILEWAYETTSHKAQLYYPSGSNMEIKFMSSGRVLTGDTSSSVSMERVHQMVHTCESEHSDCGPGRHERFPTRLVDLEMLDQGLACVRIAEFGAAASTRGTYACLSHCWGKERMPVRTTRNNLKEHINSIDLESLPLTFRDAFTICRRLGLRYIWIDSLCIVQDCPKDWASESAKMASIYQNSFITVAATAASDFRGGCFSKSNQDTCFRLKYGGVLDTIIAVRAEVVGDFSQLFPLFTRGWVHQERMLSRRLLYCNRGELQLECSKDLACECGNTKIMRPGASFLGRLGAKSRYHHPGSDRLSSSWQTTVMTYTTLGLTKPSDKLPAISGCAQAMKSLGRGRYLGGLWENTFVEELLWVANNHFQCFRPTEWRAPSWSWASIDAPDGIRFLSGSISKGRGGSIESMQVFRDKIIEVNCDPLGSDDTGELKPRSSNLRLKSRLGKGHIRRFCGRCRSARAKKHTKNRYVLETDTLTGNWESRGYGPCKFAVHGIERHGGTISLYEDFRYEKKTLNFIGAENNGHCLLAPFSLLEIMQIGSVAEPITAMFLALKDVEKEQKAMYERIGLVEITFSDRSRWNDWFEQAFTPRLGPEIDITIV